MEPILDKDVPAKAGDDPAAEAEAPAPAEPPHRFELRTFAGKLAPDLDLDSRVKMYEWFEAQGDSRLTIYDEPGGDE